VSLAARSPARRHGVDPDAFQGSPLVARALASRHYGRVLALAEAGRLDGAAGRAVVRTLREHLSESLGMLQRLRERDPWTATCQLQQLAERYAGCAEGAALAPMWREWRRDPATEAERRARRVLEHVEQILAKLPDAGVAADRKYVHRHRRALREIMQGLRVLKQRHGETWARRKAEMLLEPLGLNPADASPAEAP